ncbi:MAG: ribonuclease H-like domain-containing protein [Candidatus Krumholzibacteria bacterium]|nr:ribonuclease H-like domain-containing protein [Candidatus Krumholzibacteria bacterium]
MLKNSFCHIPGIGAKSEQRLWSLGLDTWESFFDNCAPRLPTKRFSTLDRHLRRSVSELEAGNSTYFASCLPGEQHWRMFPEFRHSLAYLDIETTGFRSDPNSITTIAVYDGREVYCYVRGRNLARFRDDIHRYKLLVTYSGKCFDIPVIEETFGIRLGTAHIDLRYVLNSLGYWGGLKTCEKQFGIDRGALDGLNGYDAVLLWDDFTRNRNERALETLLAYNIEDVINLETLMVAAYNKKIRGTPFASSHQHRLPSTPATPYRPDAETIRRIRRLFA